jgi:hypothetical protein
MARGVSLGDMFFVEPYQIINIPLGKVRITDAN